MLAALFSLSKMPSVRIPWVSGNLLIFRTVKKRRYYEFQSMGLRLSRNVSSRDHILFLMCFAIKYMGSLLYDLKIQGFNWIHWTHSNVNSVRYNILNLKSIIAPWKHHFIFHKISRFSETHEPLVYRVFEMGRSSRLLLRLMLINWKLQRSH